MKKKQRSDASEGEARNEQNVSPGGEAESFGPWLRRQREMREIDLREIADASKISLRYLQAFEDNRFEELPADVFSKGFLRNYARFVGIDPEEAVNFYSQARKEAALDQEEDEITRVVRIRGTKSASSRHRESANRRFVMVILLAAALLLFLIWQLSQWQQRQDVEETSPLAVALPAVTAGETGPEAESVPAGESAATEFSADSGDPGGASGGADGTSEVASPAAPATTPATPSPREAAPGVDPAQALDAQVTSGDLIRVTLDFQGQCWVEAQVDGKRQQSATRAQGEAIVLAGNELIEIKLGDYRAARVEVNGKPIDIKPDSPRGSTVRLRFDLPYVATLTGVPLETLKQALTQRQKTGAR